MADDYERLADKIELSHEEALALKEAMRKREEYGELAADLVHRRGGTLFHGWTDLQRQVS